MYDRKTLIEQTDPELWAAIQAENLRQVASGRPVPTFTPQPAPTLRTATPAAPLPAPEPIPTVSEQPALPPPVVS